ncbi:MAG: two-component system response regulator CreB [Formosimonas sp.]
MSTPRVWLVEDEAAIAQTLLYALQTDGFAATWFERGEPMLAEFAHNPPDLLILDVGLPDLSGFEIARRISATHDLPFIFLTARAEEIDRLLGLEIGADDYIAKPFSPREVCARVRMILRRIQRSAPASVNPSVFTLNEAHGIITFYGERLSLTRYEFLLLKTLLNEPLRIFPRQLLMDLIWTDALDSFDRTVDTHIKTLRAKLRLINAEFEPIVTHRGLGYSISTAA